MKIIIKDGYIVCQPQTLDELNYCLANAEQNKTTCAIPEVKGVKARGKRTHCPIVGCKKMVQVGWGLLSHIGRKHKEVPKEQRKILAGLDKQKRHYPPEAARRGWETRRKRIAERTQLPSGVEVLSG